MKKILTGFSIIVLMFLGACSAINRAENTEKSPNNAEAIEKKSEGNKLNESVVVDGIELKIKQLKNTLISKNQGKENEMLYSFEISGKNISDAKLGLGAIDFVMTTTDGNEYKIDDTISNFGNEIEPSKSLSGKAYFAIPKDKKVKQLHYKPLNKALSSWNVKIK